MFWGMLLEPGTRYKTTVSEAFAITHAALEYKNLEDNACVKILYKELEFIMCYLNAKTERQVSLDLKFDVGEECVVTSIGSGTVHLTGYSEQEEEEEDQDDQDQLLALALREAAKKKKDKLEYALRTGDQEKGKARKEKVAFEESSDDDDEENSDLEGLDDEEDVDEEGEEDDDVEEEEESDVEMEEEKPQPVKLTKAQKKQLKKDQMKPAEKQFKKPIEMELKPQGKKGKLQEQNGGHAEVGTPEMAKKKKKKNKYQEDSDDIILPLKKPKMAGDSPAAHLLQTPRGDVAQKKWGVTMTTISKGNGPVATTGKNVTVHCRGFVKTTGKEFEKYGEGKPLSFVLGKNEVIRGLDIGVKGMHVGEKRRLEIPPKAGYGDDGRPPKVPPHATLLYEVELKSVS